MKNKIFNVWIKELCSLVFVQSLQALLMAVMLAIIVKLYVDSGAKADEASDGITQALGVYAIFIMSIIPKIELLVKKIFGLGSGVADASMMGGKGSLIKTGLAIKGGLSLLNNVPKIIGGAAGYAGSRLGLSHEAQQKRIAKKNLNIANYKDRINNNRIAGKNMELDKDNYNINSEASEGQIPRNNVLLTSDDLIKALNNGKSKDPNAEYREAVHNLKQKRRENLKKMTGGLLETAGAIGGAALGGVVGLAQGEDVAQNMIIGAGAGDKIGNVVNDVTIGSYVNATDYMYTRKENKEDLKKKRKELNSLKSQLDELEKNRNKSATTKTNTNNINSNGSNNSSSGGKTSSSKNTAFVRKKTPGVETELDRKIKEKINKLKQENNNSGVKVDNNKRTIKGIKNVSDIYGK